MAGDWIKMRPSLLTSPKVNAIAKGIASNREASDFLTSGYGGAPEDVLSRYALRYVTVTALLQVWGACNEHSANGFLKGAELSDVDDISGIPSFGELMEQVGWIEVHNGGLLFVNFEEYNTCGKDRHLEKNAERQRRYRERKRQSVTDRNVTRDVTRNGREEKRREEKNTLSHPLLENPQFAKEWKRWKAHRIEKQKPIGQIEAETQLMQLGHYTPEEAAQIVEHSTSRGAMNLIQDGSHKPRDAQKAPYAQQNRRVPRLEDVLPQ